MAGASTSSVGLAACVASAGALALVAACYLRGLRRLRCTDAGRRRSGRPWALATAVVVTGVVTTPPLGEHLEQRLSTHMLQHIVLITVAAPLLAVCGLGLPVLVGMPGVVRRRLTRLRHRWVPAGLVGPHLAWGAHIAALWLWHLPAAYDEAVRSWLAHATEHACFLLTAWLFWWHILGPARRRLDGLSAALYLVAAIPPGAALGALLIFSSQPLYADQSRAAAASGADPLTDQRLGGLVMWVPLDFAYVGLAVLLLGLWLRALRRRWPEPEYGDVDAALVRHPVAGGLR
jgi:cytochrome c oxidase assembly factor CtaG